MEFTEWLASDLILTGIVLLWARWARLDLGLRSPIISAVWPWIVIYMVLYAAEWAIFAGVYPAGEDPDWVAWLRQLPLSERLILMVVTGPVLEEILFRGAMFSALLRRWGTWVAAIVPSILWALLHVGYEPWFVASIAISGVVLAIIRWKSGSLYVPLFLHVAGNLLTVIDLSPWLPGAA